jgi:hypothetical protein
MLKVKVYRVDKSGQMRTKADIFKNFLLKINKTMK